MTYLELCQALRREAGVSGSGPASVASQTSMYGKIVSWVEQAWTEIQLSRPQWRFMISQFEFDTIAAQRDYTAAGVNITDFSLWDSDSFLIYEKSVGEIDQNRLRFLTYPNWRDGYRNQMNVRDDDRPTLFTIMPNSSVRFEARPDKIYTIDGDYKRSAQVFSENADTPTGLPDDFHMIIVWRALMFYADDQNAGDSMDKAIAGYDTLLNRLENEQLPAFDEDFEALA